MIFLLLLISTLVHASPSPTPEQSPEPPIQTITITADRAAPNTLGHAMSSSYTITAPEMAIKKYRNVYEALRDIPGVDVVAPNLGQTSSIFIRGNKSEQTLVLIDGVEFNDPTDPGRGADLSQLLIDNMERIEVVRGAQSIQFAGVGGVINIITKSGADRANHLLLEMGSRATIRGEMLVSGKTDNGTLYSVGASAFTTDGISAAAAGTERDGAKNISLSAKAVHDIGKKTKIEGVFRYFDAKNDLDQVPTDTPDFKASQQNLLFSLQGKSRRGNWEPTLGISARFIDRLSLNASTTPSKRFQSSGSILKTEGGSRFYWGENHQWASGVSFSREHSQSFSDFGGSPSSTDTKADLTTIFSQYDYVAEWGPFFGVGARADYHSTFFFRPSYRANAGFGVEATKTIIRATGGTGTKAPSLYQLYGEFGNTSLKPEESLSFDVGVEQQVIPKELSLVATYFRNYLRELVDFDVATSRYFNLGKARTEGVELSLSWQLTKEITWVSQYTFMETQDEETGLTLLRRPRQKWKNSIAVRLPSLEISLDHLLVGVRTDLDSSTFGRKEMNAYQTVGLAVGYQLPSDWKLFAKIENLFHSSYQVVDGYSTPGFSVFGGAKLAL